MREKWVCQLCAHRSHHHNDANNIPVNNGHHKYDGNDVADQLADHLGDVVADHVGDVDDDVDSAVCSADRRTRV